MKLETNLRPQDKRTIGIVLYIAVVALFCWYMIRPAWIKLGDLDDKIDQAEATKQEYRMKTMNLGTAEILYDKAVTDLENSTKDFYNVMDNSEIEKMGTEYILRFGLMPVDFNVNLRDGSYVVEAPYAYADITQPQIVDTDTSDTTDVLTASVATGAKTLASLDVKSLQVYYSQAINSANSTTQSEVECATISIVVQGPQSKCQAFIDDITKKPSIRVTSFSWSNAAEIWTEDEFGNKTLMNAGYKELRMELNLYMTDKPNFEDKEG